MSFWVAGFNGFRSFLKKEFTIQGFHEIDREILNIHGIKHDYDLLPVWYYNVFQMKHKKEYIISGFSFGDFNSCKPLNVPEELHNEEADIKLGGNDRNIFMLNVTDQSLWQCNLGAPFDKCWKRVSNFLNVETPLVIGNQCISPDETVENIEIDKINVNTIFDADANVDAVPLVKSDRMVKLSVSNSMCLVLTEKGTLYEVPRRLHVDNCQGRIIEASSGHEHGVLLTDQGYVYTWGAGSRCQLGHGEMNAVLTEPQLVEALAGIKIVKIKAGGWHTCALSVTGDLYSWGWNECGQLGFRNIQSIGNTDLNMEIQNLMSSDIPRLVDVYQSPSSTSPIENHIIDVSCGSKHTAIMLDDFSVWTSGCNDYFQLGVPDANLKIQPFFIKVFQCSEKKDVLSGHWCTVII